MWRSRRWRKLWNIIQNLPRNSHYVQAISLDHDLARASLARNDKPPEAQHLPMSEYSTEVEVLHQIYSMIGNVMSAVVASGGNKPPRIRPLPGPRTAYQIERSKRRAVKHRSLVSRVIPQQT